MNAPDLRWPLVERQAALDQSVDPVVPFCSPLSPNHISGDDRIDEFGVHRHSQCELISSAGAFVAADLRRSIGEAPARYNLTGLGVWVDPAVDNAERVELFRKADRPGRFTRISLPLEGCDG